MARIKFNTEFFAEINNFHNENLKKYRTRREEIHKCFLDNGNVKTELTKQRHDCSETQAIIEELESKLQKVEKVLKWAKNSQDNYTKYGSSSIINQPLDDFMDDAKVGIADEKVLLKKKPTISLDQPIPQLKEKKENSWDQKAMGIISQTIPECDAVVKKLFSSASNQLNSIQLYQPTEDIQTSQVKTDSNKKGSNQSTSNKSTSSQSNTVNEEMEKRKFEPVHSDDDHIALRSIPPIHE